MAKELAPPVRTFKMIHELPTFARLAWEYSSLVFGAGLGVLQVAAAYGGFKGLLLAPGDIRFRFLTRSRILTISRVAFSYLFAMVTVAPALVYFFIWNQRNETGIIEGPEQAAFFVLSMASAVAFTFISASIINHWRLRHNEPSGTGLEALKEITWVQAITRRWRKKQHGLG